LTNIEKLKDEKRINVMYENRTSKTIKNMKFGFLYQVIFLILSFVSRSFFIKYIGVEFLGINALFADILLFLSIADLGFDTVMMYSLYKPIAENNKEKISNLIKYYKKIYRYIAIIVIIVGILIIPFLDLIVNSNIDSPNLKLYFFIFIINSSVSYLFIYKSLLLNADQQKHLIYKVQIITNILKVTLQILAIIIFNSYLLFIIIMVLSTLFHNIYISLVVNRKYPYLNNYDSKISKSEVGSIKNNVKSVFMYKSSSLAMTSTDNILISTIIGTVVVGIYSNYLLIINTLQGFINIIFNSANASIGNLVSVSSSKEKIEVFKTMQSFSMILNTFITILLYFLINDFIYVWLGSDFIVAEVTVIAIVSNFYFSGLVRPVWSFRESTGMYNETKFIMLICAVLNIILSIILGILFGISGILFASLISRLLTYFWYEPIILFKKYFNHNPIEYFKNVVVNFGSVIVIIFVLSIILKSIVVTSFFLLIVKFGAVSVLLAIMLLLINIRSRGFKLIKKTLLTVIFKK
jgi:O-antigen/teichoic acid export membrane protein